MTEAEGLGYCLGCSRALDLCECPPPEPLPERPEDSFEDSVQRLIAELLDSGDLENIPSLEPLIADVLFRDTLTRMYGDSGAFKSFMALGFAACVGTGHLWHGRTVRQGLVIYLVAEGSKGIRRRVRAWEQHHGRKMTGVKFLPRPVQVRSPEWAVLIEVCRRLRPALIVVDTQARVTVGVEENSATEMGVVLHLIEQLRAACEACVLLVHHSGINGDRGRGSTSIKGGMQTELGVSRTGKGVRDIRVTLKTSKQKDDEELDDLTFELRQIELDGEAKEDGRPVTSVVLVPTGEAAGPVPGSVEDVIAKLDTANMPLEYGRRKVRSEMTKLGVPLPHDRVLGPAIKQRQTRLQGGAESGAETPQISKIEAPLWVVPDPGTTPDETAGHSGAAPAGTSGHQDVAGQWCPPTHPFRGGHHLAPPGAECPACGWPTDSDGHEQNCGGQS